jgi:hypothetical protein
MRIPIAAVLAVALLSALACGASDPVVFGNVLDPTSADYVPPSTTIASGPEDAATVTEADVTFTWRGSDQVNEHRYRLDQADWSEWGAATSATFELLDEGDHVFAVMGRYPTGDAQVQPSSRAFVVDAVTGPALMFRPRKVIAAPGDTFSVDLIAEEVADLMLAHVTIEYDDGALSLESVTQGDFLAGTGGSVVFLEELTPGSVLLDTAVAEGDPAGVSGTGVLATLVFRANASTTTAFRFADGAVFRDPGNAETPIVETVPGAVVVE